jgi:hypothetical protein
MTGFSLILFHLRQTVHMAAYFLGRRRLNQIGRIFTGRSRRAVPVAGRR